MEQNLPDIKALYQRKFIYTSSSPTEQASKDPKEILLQRAQRFHDRVSPHIPHSSRPAYIKIIKQSPASQHHHSNYRSDTVAIATSRVTSSSNNKKGTHSSMVLPPHQDLMQILQVSHQELADLQSSMGGEKTLMGLLNTFFQRRHERQQVSRAHRKSTECKPVQNLQVKRQQEERNRQFRIKKEQAGREDSRQRERELAPWSVQEIQHP